MPNIKNIALGITVDTSQAEQQLNQFTQRAQRAISGLTVNRPSTNIMGGLTNAWGSNIFEPMGGPYRGSSVAGGAYRQEDAKLYVARRTMRSDAAWISGARGAGTGLSGMYLDTVYGAGIPNLQAPSMIGGWAQGQFSGRMPGAGGMTALGAAGMTAGAAIGAFSGAYGLAYGAANYYGQYGAARQQLEFATRGQQGAGQIPSYIGNLSASTATSQTDLFKSAKNLAGYGFNAKEIGSGLQMISNIAAATGANFDNLAYAIGTMRSEGVMLARDLRQLTSQGVDIVPELGKVLAQRFPELARGRAALSNQEVMSQIHQGAVTSDVSFQALSNMNVGKYAGASEVAAKTTAGLGHRFLNVVNTGSQALLESALDVTPFGPSAATKGLRGAMGITGYGDSNAKWVMDRLSLRNIAHGGITLWEEALKDFQGVDKAALPSPLLGESKANDVRAGNLRAKMAEAMGTAGLTNRQFGNRMEEIDMLSRQKSYTSAEKAFTLSHFAGMPLLEANTIFEKSQRQKDIMNRTGGLNADQTDRIVNNLMDTNLKDLAGTRGARAGAKLGDMIQHGMNVDRVAGFGIVQQNMINDIGQQRDHPLDIFQRYMAEAGNFTLDEQQMLGHGALGEISKRAAFRPSSRNIGQFLSLAEGVMARGDPFTNKMVQSGTSGLMNNIIASEMQNPNAYQGLVGAIGGTRQFMNSSAMLPGQANANIVGAYQQAMQRAGTDTYQLPSVAMRGSLEDVGGSIASAQEGRFSIQENLQRMKDASDEQARIMKQIAEALQVFADNIGVRGPGG